MLILVFVFTFVLTVVADVGEASSPATLERFGTKRSVTTCVIIVMLATEVSTAAGIRGHHSYTSILRCQSGYQGTSLLY